MKVTFIGDPNVAKDRTDECVMFGRVFVRGEAVDVSDLPEAQQEKLANNKHFQVGAKRGRPKKAAEDVTEEAMVEDDGADAQSD